MQGDERWTFTLPDGRVQTIPVKGPLRSNNLSAVLAACREGMGLAVLPHYVARASLADGALVPVLPELQLPSQELHAVYPSPKLLPGKVQVFVSWLQSQLSERWWERRF